MSRNWLEQDPEAQAEASKYQNPVPSRTYLLSFLSQWGAPIGHEALCQELGIHPGEDAFDAVMFRLKAMCRDGQLMSNRKNEFGLVDHMDLMTCRIIGHREGFGFAHPETGEDLFLSPRQMRQVFDGDKAVVQEIGRDPRGRREGKIVEVIERNTTKLVGRFQGKNGFGHLRSENQRITHEIMVIADPESKLRYKDGQLVVVEITQQPGKRNMPQGQVIEVLGDHLAPGMEIKVAIHSYGIPEEWSDEVRQQIGELTPEVPESAKGNRVDLRDLPLVTIDGEDARDFDDAVYAERKKSGGWRLWVAIADVSSYVAPGTPLDIEAHGRGNSVYFPEYVVPMLPELLSNGLCSLNPKVDRLAMVCEMTISDAGRLSGYKFYEAVINSHARLTYTKVGKMLLEPQTKQGKALCEEYSAVLPHLKVLHQMYFALRKARDLRGAMDFDTVETRIVFGEDRKIERIVPVHRNDAHKIIEECMLCANVATARFLKSAKVPTLYRVHDGPKTSRLEGLRGYLGELGLELAGGEKPEPQDYQLLAAQIEERPDRHVIQTMMLRSMAQAVYSPEEKGHFGLAYPAYTHFTSPIRRYPDLLVHRAIRGLIHAENPPTQVVHPEGFVANPAYRYGYTMEMILQLGEHCSMTERRADDATRDVMAWLKCEYMQQEIGQQHQGVITAVTGFGLFVELDNIYIEGLIHITGLPSDYYHFEANKQRLVGERTRRVFKMGDRLSVQVAAVNLDDRKIDFEFLEQHQSRKVKTKSKRELLAEGRIGEAEGKWHSRKSEAHNEGDKKPKRGKGKTKKVSGKPGAKASAKQRLSSAEKELAAFSAKAKGKSNKAKKRKAKAKR